MAFTYDIKTSKDDKLSRNCLFACHRINSVVKMFLSTFLVGYIYQFSGSVGDYIYKVGLYEIFTYLTLAVMFFVLMPIVEKSNRVWVYRIGLVLRAMFVGFAIFFGKDLGKLIILAGFINGFSEGFYYPAYNVLRQEMVSRKKMGGFIVFGQIVEKVVGVIVPLVLGALIEVSSFATIAIYVFVVAVAQLIISFGIKAKRPENSNFDLIGFFKKIKNHDIGSKKIRFSYLLTAVFGFTSITTTLLNICTMLQFKSSLSLGVFSSVFAGVSIVSILIFSKFTKTGRREKVFLILALFSPLFTCIYALFSSVATLFVYNIVVGALQIIYTGLFETYRNSTLKEVGLYDCIPEHQTIMEVLLDVIRIVAYSLLFLFNLSGSLQLFKVFLCVISLSSSIMFVLLAIYERKFFKKDQLSDRQVFKIISKSLKDLK